jgi:hypothetical protein
MSVSLFNFIFIIKNVANVDLNKAREKCVKSGETQGFLTRLFVTSQQNFPLLH